jgi:hypothetical protein
VITNVVQIDAEWLQGICNGRQGIFPANYVAPCQQTASQPQSQKPAQQQAVTNLQPLYIVVPVYDFTAKDSHDISFAKRDEVLIVLQRLSPEWLRCQARSDPTRIGNIPTNYVTEVRMSFFLLRLLFIMLSYQFTARTVASEGSV